jgi:hypothetical protein
MAQVLLSRTDMCRPFRRIAYALIAATALTASSCTRQDTRIQQLTEEFASLRATTTGIGEAWVAGDVSGTYALTALDQTLRMLDRQRTELTTSPRSLLDPRGSRLSQAGERLSRLVVVLGEDVHRGDADSARGHMAEISTLTPERQ